MNPYQVLGIDPQASPRSIKKAFNSKARTCHPDKYTGREEEFTNLRTAYEILADPYKKLQYDDKTFGSQHLLHNIRREEAIVERELMENLYTSVRNYEQSQKGIIIQSAMYGIIPSSGSPQVPQAHELAGKWVDVTVPLQCLIQNSSLIVEAGESKQSLQGFCLPSNSNINMDQVRLKVTYLFREQMHQVQVLDRQELRLPLQVHQVANKKLSELRQSNYEKHRRRLEKLESRAYERMKQEQTLKNFAAVTTVCCVALVVNRLYQ